MRRYAPLTRFSVLLLLATLLGAGTVAYGAPGSLDGTFGNGGKVVTSFANSSAPFQDAIAADVALQLDSKIVVALGLQNSTIATEAFGVARYLSSGRLDGTFGKGGSVQTAFTNFINAPSSLAIQADGKIVVAGTASSADGTLSEFALARFTTSGSLDTSFGGGGKVTTNFVGVKQGGVFNPANAVLIQADGKIVVGGGAEECGKCITNTAIARYNTNGSLDSTFGSGGKVDLNVIGAVNSVAEDAAGNIFAVGSTIAEFSSSGVLKSITPGPVTISSHGGSIVFQSDGRFLQGQSATDVSRHDTDAKVVRFNQTGSVDPTFNNPPFDYTNEGAPGSDSIAALALQSNAQVIAAGGGFGLARLNSDGNLDPTFGTGGVVNTSFPGQSSATINAVIVQADGKLLGVGTGFNNTTGLTALVLARYLAQ